MLCVLEQAQHARSDVNTVGLLRTALLRLRINFRIRGTLGGCFSFHHGEAESRDNLVQHAFPIHPDQFI